MKKKILILYNIIPQKKRSDFVKFRLVVYAQVKGVVGFILYYICHRVAISTPKNWPKYPKNVGFATTGNRKGKHARNCMDHIVIQEIESFSNLEDDFLHYAQAYQHVCAHTRKCMVEYMHAPLQGRLHTRSSDQHLSSADDPPHSFYDQK